MMPYASTGFSSSSDVEPACSTCPVGSAAADSVTVSVWTTVTVGAVDTPSLRPAKYALTPVAVLVINAATTATTNAPRRLIRAAWTAGSTVCCSSGTD